MGKTYDRIDARLKKFIEDQPMFFVATAPTAPDGYVNVSPKGYRDTFAVIDDHTFAYLDLFGSGVETIAHLRDTGRITVMFCSFGRNSNIVRLCGAGRVHRPDTPEFDRYRESFIWRTPVSGRSSPSISSGSLTRAATASRTWS